MAMLPSGYVVSATGVYTNYPTEKLNGGTALGITDGTSITTNLLTRRFTVKDAANDSLSTRRVVATQASGVNHAFNATKALTSGTFAYESTSFLLRTYTSTINGSANTSLLINGNEQHRLRQAVKEKSWGAKTLTAWAAGYFRWNRTVGSANVRSAWSTTPSTLNETFKSTTNNGTDADDTGQYVTYRSVPGELVYLQGGLTPYQDDYKAITG